MKTAFTIEYDGKQRIWSGDWVKFRGNVRINPGLRKTGPRAGEPIEENLAYYHIPIDGSPQAEWWYFDLTDHELKVIGPLDMIEKMNNAVNLTRRHLDSWQHNNSVAAFIETEDALNEAIHLVHGWRLALQEREREMNAPITTIDINV